MVYRVPDVYSNYPAPEDQAEYRMPEIGEADQSEPLDHNVVRWHTQEVLARQEQGEEQRDPDAQAPSTGDYSMDKLAWQLKEPQCAGQALSQSSLRY